MQVAGGLVGQQQRRRVNHGPRNAYQLLLPAGELAWIEVLFGHDLKAVENVSHHPLALVGGKVLVTQWQIDVFGHGQIVQQVIALEDHADALAGQVGALLAIELVHRRFAKPVLALPPVVEQRQHVQ